MLNSPFFQITLPLMATFITVVWAATWSQNKRFDDLNKRLDERFGEINRRLDNIEARLTRIEQTLNDLILRVTTLEMTKWR